MNTDNEKKAGGAHCGTTSDATERPWDYEVPFNNKSTTYQIVGTGKFAGIVAETTNHWYDPQTGKANAELIVRAVNAHDELVANLKGLIAWIDHARLQAASAPHMPDASYLKSAREALKKAGAGK